MWSEGGPTTVVEFRRERVSPFADRRVRAQLNGQMREFIARQEMVFVSAGGECSMRSGAPGFVSAPGRRHLAWAGCSVGRASLLFVDFFDEVGSLHIAGRGLVGGRFAVEEACFGGGFGGR